MLVIKIEPDVSPDVIGGMFQAIREFETKTLIRFKMLSNEKDFISINAQDGCSSALGRQGAQQSLSLGNGCGGMATVIHEFMHALGVKHTQTRLDRDEYVTIIKDNIDPDKYHNFEKHDYQYRNRVEINN